MATISDFPAVPQPHHDLVAALDLLAGQVSAELPAGIALERCQALMAQTPRLQVLLTDALGDVHRRQLYALHDAPSAAAWVDSQAISGVDRSQLALAKRLEKVPLLSAALRAGTLSIPTAQMLALTLTKARPHCDRLDGLIDGLPAEDVLHGVIVDGIGSLLAQQHGGELTVDEALALRTELEAVLALPDTQISRLEQALLLLADRSQPALLPGCLAMLLDALLPARHDKRAADAHDQRGLLLQRRFGGSGWDLTAVLDDTAGQLLSALLAAAVAEDPDSPRDTAARAGAAASTADTGDDLLGHDPSLWPDTDRHNAPLHPPRSRRQRNADAFTSILQNAALTSSHPTAAADTADRADTADTADAGAGAGAGEGQGQGSLLPEFLPAPVPGPAVPAAAAWTGWVVRPAVLAHLVMTCSLDFAHGLPGALPATSPSGARWSRTQVRELLCRDTRLTRQVLDLQGRVVEASHTGRTLKAHERLIKATETGNTCERHGCSHGPGTGHRLIPHHPELYSRTGRTSVRDTRNLCEPDHAHLRRGHTLRLGDGRLLGPDGWLPRRT